MMKCELCHKSDAKAAIKRSVNGEEEELYVCEACAAHERQRRQNKSQKTRKVQGLPPGVSMSITQVGGDVGGEQPPIIEAIMNAFEGMVKDIDPNAIKHSIANPGSEISANPARRKPLHDFPAARVESQFRLRGMLHLEGLYLIGELEAVERAMRAMGVQLEGLTFGLVRNAAHVFRLRYPGSAEFAKRVVADLITQERNARVRLFEEMTRVFGDSLCRSLAILKNCRLLAPAEYLDLLSPLRLAAIEGMLDGIDQSEIENLIESLDLATNEDLLDPVERDRIDAERADEVNAKFADVVMNERGEERFL